MPTASFVSQDILVCSCKIKHHFDSHQHVWFGNTGVYFCSTEHNRKPVEHNGKTGKTVYSFKKGVWGLAFLSEHVLLWVMSQMTFESNSIKSFCTFSYHV